MRIPRIIMAMTALFVMVSGLSAQNLSKMDVLGKEYYVYEVKKGDTMYGLSRKFGWSDETLGKYNPGAVSPLKSGSLLYYPVDEKRAIDTDRTTSVGEGGVLKHRIRRGETVSSISRMYDVPVSQLNKLNPGCEDGIKAGEWLIVSGNSGDGDNTGQEAYYTVKSGDTIYGIAKRYGVSIESLMKCNPGISERNFQTGAVIRIPERGTGVRIVRQQVEETVLNGFSMYKVEKSDTWESVAEKLGIPVDLLKSANKGVEFKNKRYIGVPLLDTRIVEKEVVSQDPREMDKEGIQSIYKEVHGIDTADQTRQTVKVAILMEDINSRKDKEFVRGFLSAVDRLKNSGYGISLKVIDGSKTAGECTVELDAFGPVIIFTTSEKDMPAWIGEYAEKSRTPVVNTFDVKNLAFQTNPYIIQLITPPDYFNEEIASWFKKNYDGYSLVFVGTPDSGDALADALKGVWDADKVRQRSVADLKSKPLADNGRYLMYGYPVKREEVRDFMEAVSEAHTKVPLAYVSVIGRPNWILYDESLLNDFKENNVHIPSRFYMPESATEVAEFNTAYRHLFDRQPAKSFPVYAAVGYDACGYFIPSLAATGGDINRMGESRDGAQSEYNLTRPRNWSGLVNNLVYVIRFSTVGNVEKIKVK